MDGAGWGVDCGSRVGWTACYDLFVDCGVDCYVGGRVLDGGDMFGVSGCGGAVFLGGGAGAAEYGEGVVVCDRVVYAYW